MNLKEKAMQKIGQRMFGGVTSLSDFFDKVGQVLTSNAEILERQGLEGKTAVLKYEGQIWKAILLREKGIDPSKDEKA